MNRWVVNAALAVVLSSAGFAPAKAESTNDALLACAKETDEARRLFQRAIAMRPDYALARENLARLDARR